MCIFLVLFIVVDVVVGVVDVEVVFIIFYVVVFIRVLCVYVVGCGCDFCRERKKFYFMFIWGFRIFDKGWVV